MYGFTSGNQTASNLTKEIYTADTDKENDNHHIALKQDYAVYGQAKRSMLEETPQFNGEMLSSGNLTYMRARNYDPLLGQFTSKDTWIGQQTNPLSQNRNTFVENNPINAIDPSGHWPDWGGMWNSTVKSAGDMWNSSTKAIGDGLNWTKDRVVEGVNYVKDRVVEGVNYVKDRVVEGVTWVKDKVVQGVQWVQNKVNQGVQWIQNKWNDTKQWYQSNVAAKQREAQARRQAEQRREEQRNEAVRKEIGVNTAQLTKLGVNVSYRDGMTEDQKLEYVRKLVQICTNVKNAVADSWTPIEIGDFINQKLNDKGWVAENLGSISAALTEGVGYAALNRGENYTGNGLLNPFLSGDKATIAKETLETGKFYNNTGSKLMQAGSKLGKAMPYLGFGLGMIDDLSSGKTFGESVAHNAFTTGASVTGTGIATSLATSIAVGLGATPVGWGLAAGIVGGVVVGLAADYAYKSNFLGLKTGLDWIGNNIISSNWGR